MSNSNNNDGKREIKIYKKIYRLPMLAGGKLDQLQKQIRQRNEHLTNGRLVVEKKEITVPTEEKRGIFSKKVIKHEKKIIEHETRKSLSFEERYSELNAIIQNYDEMVKVLKLHQYDYQKFFQELAQEIRVTIGENCNEILEKEKKRQLKEQQERQKVNPLPQSLAMLSNMESQLFEIAKSTGYAAVLMLKKLDLMSESLQRIANDQDMQKQLLAQVLEEIRSQKDLYELQLEINALQAKTAEFVDIALNFEEYMKPFMGSFQSLLSNVATVDQELSKAMGEIQNIANLLEAQQFRSIESDRDSQRIADFLARSEIKKDRLQEALEQMGNARAGAEFDAQLLGTGKGISIDDCLGNIRDFLDVKLDNLKMDLGAIAVSAIEVNEPDVNFYALEPSKDVNLDLGNGVALNLVDIPAGSFMMGSNDYANEKKPHQVTLKAFQMSKYPITQKQYRLVMGTNPSSFQGDENCPVENLSWHDAVKFCEELSKRIGQKVKLPTEAQWEYACRAGSTGKYCFGDDDSKLGNYAWYDKNSGSRTHPVGEKLANSWGLHDMHGNVWEWCEDVWHENYNGAPTDGSAWLTGGEQNRRALRGGSWFDNVINCRSANRDWNVADDRDNDVGFRVVV
jgi:formylglycine-generating enzyme required for sulfatase activity